MTESVANSGELATSFRDTCSRTFSRISGGSIVDTLLFMRCLSCDTKMGSLCPVFVCVLIPGDVMHTTTNKVSHHVRC